MDTRFAIVAGAAALLVLLWTTMYTVSETERALLIEFGEIQDPELEPGLDWKLPWQDVRRFDARVQVLDTRPTEYLTQESKILEVDAFVIWRIASNQQYYTATGGNVERARDLIAQRAIDGLKNKVSQRTLNDVVSGKRDEMMAELTKEVAERTNPELGVEIIDIRVKKVDYPEGAIESVFGRMRADRDREAREYRAEGREQAEKIRAEAEKERTVIVAEAFRSAQKLRGEGDARAAAVSAAAYGKDPEFFRFWRSMQAYRESFAAPENVIVVQPDSPFFSEMKGR